MNRREFSILCSLPLGLTGPVLAQSKPARIVVGFPAGGSSDALARLLAQAARGKLDGPAVVDNRAGAGGRLAAEYLRGAESDGSVLLITPNPVVTIYPHVYKRLSYDPLKDLQPVARVATYPLVIAVGPMVPTSVKTFGEFVGWLKANPDKSFYGSPGAGSTPHFVGQMIGKAVGVELSHVAYKGDAPGIQDLMAGQIAMSINTPAAQVPQLPSGRLRILATTGPKRMAYLPDVPTLLELGMNIQTADWFGAFLPPGAPAPIVQRWQELLREALIHAEVREGLQKLQLDPGFLPAPEFARAIRVEYAQWAGVVKASGFTPEE